MDSASSISIADDSPVTFKPRAGGWTIQLCDTSGQRIDLRMSADVTRALGDHLAALDD